MLIKNTRLTEALRERLEAAGVERTLSVHQHGPDIYVGAEIAPEEQIEVVAIVAAHSVEPFEDPPPRGISILQPFTGDVATVAYRGPRATEYIYGITEEEAIRDHTDYSDRDAKAMPTPREVELWLKAAARNLLPLPLGIEPSSWLNRDEVAALMESRGLTHDCARFSITNQGGLRVDPGENDTMPHDVAEWLTAFWRRETTA